MYKHIQWIYMQLLYKVYKNYVLLLLQHALNIHPSGVELAVLFQWFLHGWCHSKLLPSRRVLCTPYNHAPYHVTSCKASYVGCARVKL